MTDIITPQLSSMSLAELREVIRASISRRAEEELIFTLEFGTALNAGRAHCENPDCGIPGDNPNQRFGKWVSETVSETPLADLLNTRTASNYMAFAREFGHLPLSTAARIGRKHGYKLAHANEDVKAAAIAQAEAGRPITPDDMDRWFSPPRTIPAQAARAAQVVEDAVIIERRPAVPSLTAPEPRVYFDPLDEHDYNDLTETQREAVIATWTLDKFGWNDPDYYHGEPEWLEAKARELEAEVRKLQAEVATMSRALAHYKTQAPVEPGGRGFKDSWTSRMDGMPSWAATCLQEAKNAKDIPNLLQWLDMASCELTEQLTKAIDHRLNTITKSDDLHRELRQVLQEYSTMREKIDRAQKDIYGKAGRG